MFEEDEAWVPKGGGEAKYTWKDAVADINDCMLIIRDIKDNYTSIFDKGEDFFRSVYKGLGSMRTTLRETREVTSSQYKAINNWAVGVQSWHPDYK